MRTWSPWLRTIAAALVLGSLAATSTAATRRYPEDSARLAAATAALRVQQNPRAAALLQTAASDGDIEAQYLLGLLYLGGIGVPTDTANAIRWLRASANGGQAEAAFVLASLLPPEQAHTWLQRSAELGYVRARDALTDPQPLLAAKRPDDQQARLAWILYCARHDDAVALRAQGRGAAQLRDIFGRDALTYAAEASAPAALAALLQLGADPRNADQAGTTALMVAAEHATPALAQSLLAAGASLEQADRQGRTALFYAVRGRQPGMVQFLLAAGAQPGSLDKRGYSVLDVAVSEDDSDLAGLLRARGATQTLHAAAHERNAGHIDPARAGDRYRGWSPLALAVSRNDLPDVRALLQAGEAVNQRTPQGDPLPRVAVDARALDALALLIQAGADVSSPGHDGHSTLTFSALNDPAALEVLLHAGASPEAHAPHESSALTAALLSGQRQSVQLLLQLGAGTDGSDASGRTPLMLAVIRDDATLVRALRERGAPLTARDQQQRSALWYAAQRGNMQVLELLLASADAAAVNAADADGLTPLALAARDGHSEVAQRLLRAGATVDSLDFDQDTPLLLAVGAGHPDVALQLLARGAAVDHQNRFGDTALMLAARHGNAQLCQLLLQAGASRVMRNANHLTAADGARARGFGTLAEELSGR